VYFHNMRPVDPRRWCTLPFPWHRGLQSSIGSLSQH